MKLIGDQINKEVIFLNDIIMYTTDDGQVKIEVKLEDENVWLTQNAMAELFEEYTTNDKSIA